jgi:hypothetical protein
MPMLPCDSCLENNWSYEFSNGRVTATCKFCDAVVSFESKRSKKRRLTKFSPPRKPSLPVSLHHRYIPNIGELTRSANVLPWE